MKKYIFNLMMGAVALLGLAACSDVDIPQAVQSAKVSNLSASVDGRTVTLNWTMPTATGLAGVNIYRNNILLEQLGLESNFVAKRQPANTDLMYTVKALYDNGNVSEGESTKVGPLVGLKVAMLLPSENDSELDDDELAAKNWFVSTYGADGDVFTPSTLPALDIKKYAALWIQIDRVGINAGVRNLPSAVVASDVIEKITTFAKAGGNLLLTKHATQLITALGRIESKYAPGLFSSGEGGMGTDIWTTNAIIGSNCDPKYDHRSHAIFAGLEVLPANDPVNGYDHESFPLEGPGMREDHNCMWDLNAYGFRPADGPNIVAAFEAKTSSTVLSTWGHVTDYCCGGIIEFKPTDTFKGYVLCIGLSAYEFNMNSSTNQYQSNIELLTKNSIDYLATQTDY